MNRQLPTFMVIGAYKCGTTSLYHYLGQHPQIFMPSRKELLYWSYVGNPDPGIPASRRSITTFEEYVACFSSAGDESAVGEVSPEYLAQAATTAPEIHRNMPWVKLIAVLRDPVERAWSDYLMYKLDGRETKSFEKALAKQSERRKKGDPTGYYLKTGFYGRQLESFYRLFERERILVVLQEDLASSTRDVMRDIFRFVGVDDDFQPSPKRYMAARFPRSHLHHWLGRIGRKLGMDVSGLYHRPNMSEEIRTRLRSVFGRDIARLAELTQLDLEAWKA